MDGDRLTCSQFDIVCSTFLCIPGDLYRTGYSEGTTLAYIYTASLSGCCVTGNTAARHSSASTTCIHAASLRSIIIIDAATSHSNFTAVRIHATTLAGCCVTGNAATVHIENVSDVVTHKQTTASSCAIITNGAVIHIENATIILHISCVVHVHPTTVGSRGVATACMPVITGNRTSIHIECGSVKSIYIHAATVLTICVCDFTVALTICQRKSHLRIAIVAKQNYGIKITICRNAFTIQAEVHIFSLCIRVTFLSYVNGTGKCKVTVKIIVSRW